MNHSSTPPQLSCPSSPGVLLRTRKPQNTSALLPSFFRELFYGTLLFSLTLGLIRWGGEGSNAIQQGLDLCYQVIIPAMFPFFIVSNMVVSLGLSHCLGKLFAPVMKPLFQLSGPCATALVLGFVGGYPVGAKTTVSLYESGQCTKEEGNRLLAFCNNSGPGFIFGVIGTGVFHRLEIGLLLYVAHILSCITVGMVLPFFTTKTSNKVTTSQSTVEVHSFVTSFLTGVTGAMQSTLQVCSFVLCFTVLLRLLSVSHVLSMFATLFQPLMITFGFPPSYSEALLIGILELTSGVTQLSQGTLSQQLTLLSFFLGWGGLSVHCQVLSFLGESGLSVGHYLCGHIFKGVLGAIYTYLLVLCFL